MLSSKVEAGGQGLLGMAEHWRAGVEQLLSLALLGFSQLFLSALFWFSYFSYLRKNIILKNTF